MSKVIFVCVVLCGGSYLSIAHFLRVIVEYREGIKGCVSIERVWGY